MAIITIEIPGKPIAKKRPRFARRRDGKGVVTYNDQETAEGKMWLQIKSQLPEGYPPLKGALMVDTCFIFPRPKSHYGTGKNSDVLKSRSPIYHTQKPDRDNLDKFALDCMNGLVFNDDAQVIGGSVNKIWSNEKDSPGITLITIYTEME